MYKCRVHINGNIGGIAKIKDAYDHLEKNKEVYKPHFKYPRGIKRTWFGFLLLEGINYGDKFMAAEEYALMINKKIQRVYIHDFKYGVNSSGGSAILDINIYEKDVELCIEKVCKVVKMFGLEPVSATRA